MNQMPTRAGCGQGAGRAPDSDEVGLVRAARPRSVLGQTGEHAPHGHTHSSQTSPANEPSARFLLASDGIRGPPRFLLNPSCLLAPPGESTHAPSSPNPQCSRLSSPHPAVAFTRGAIEALSSTPASSLRTPDQGHPARALCSEGPCPVRLGRSGRRPWSF